jgi:hypothetical protein
MEPKSMNHHKLLKVQFICICYISILTKITSTSLLSLSLQQQHAPSHLNSVFKLRGGSTSTATKSSQIQNVKQIQNYKLQQQHLLQLRSTFLSEALAARGIHVGPTMVDVSTPEGSKPPQEVDWDCCLSTVDDPKVSTSYCIEK